MLSSDFSVCTKRKAVFAVASFRDSSSQFFNPAWCSNLSMLSYRLANIYFYFSLLEAVLRECLNFLFFHPHVVLEAWLPCRKIYSNIMACLQKMLENGY